MKDSHSSSPLKVGKLVRKQERMCRKTPSPAYKIPQVYPACIHSLGDNSGRYKNVTRPRELFVGVRAVHPTAAATRQAHSWRRHRRHTSHAGGKSTTNQ